MRSQETPLGVSADPGMRPRGEPGEHVSDVHGVLVWGAPGAGAGAGAGAGVTEATVPCRGGCRQARMASEAIRENP